MGDNKKKTVQDSDIGLDSVDISDSSLRDSDQEARHSRDQSNKVYKKYLRSSKEKKISLAKKVALFLIVTGLIIVGLLSWPRTRWPILNRLGFTSSVKLQVLSSGDSKPVSLAEVSLNNDVLGQTDADGYVTFQDRRLGDTKLTVSKNGYETREVSITNGLGETNVRLDLSIIGIKLDVDIKDWLTDDSIKGAKVSFGSNKVESDKTGRASIVVPPSRSQTVILKIEAAGYKTKSIKTDVGVEGREVALVSDQKDYFISNRDGKYDVYSSTLDGKEVKKMIEASGKEDPDLLQFDIDRSNRWAVLVANRDGLVRNGLVVAGVYIIDLENSSIKKIDQGSDINVLGWSSDSLVYSMSLPELRYNNPELSRMIKYTPSRGVRQELDKANFFGVSSLNGNKLIYQKQEPATDTDKPPSNPNGLTVIDVASGARNELRKGTQFFYSSTVDPDIVRLVDGSNNYLDLSLSSLGLGPSSSRRLVDYSFNYSSDGTKVLWVDKRDGKGNLLIKNLTTGKQSTKAKSGGLTNPVRFISDELAVYRVANSNETADYVINLRSGKSAKIIDVVDTKKLKGIL